MKGKQEEVFSQPPWALAGLCSTQSFPGIAPTLAHLSHFVQAAAGPELTSSFWVAGEEAAPVTEEIKATTCQFLSAQTVNSSCHQFSFVLTQTMAAGKLPRCKSQALVVSHQSAVSTCRFLLFFLPAFQLF